MDFIKINTIEQHKTPLGNGKDKSLTREKYL